MNTKNLENQLFMLQIKQNKQLALFISEQKYFGENHN